MSKVKNKLQYREYFTFLEDIEIKLIYYIILIIFLVKR